MQTFYTTTRSALLLILSTFNFQLLAVQVDVDIESQFFGSAPIAGTVIVSHSKEEKIDPTRFKLGNEPLKVELIKEEPMTASGDLVLSLFRFQLPPKTIGLHIFPEVTVVIGGKDYQSVPRTYEVKDAASNNYLPPPQAQIQSQQYSPPQTSLPQAVKPQPYLQLKTYIDGPEELYPGQQIMVGYRYFYTSSLDTTQEVIPLLDAEGFTKIGDKLIAEKELNGMSVQQITQKIEAKEPGDYTFGPSILEGYSYELDSGRKVYSKEKLSSTAPAITLHVVPFPKADKPPSFNGAIGNFTWTVKLVSPTTVHVGDEIELSIDAKGDGNLDSVKLPELCCQPGMSGLFRLSDLPPVGEAKGDTKHFDVKLRPLSTAIKAVPQLEFSNFDPSTKKYVLFHSDPIPLTVISLPSATSQPEPEAKSLPATPAQPEKESPKEQALPSEPSVEAIDIGSSYPLQSKDLHNLPFGTWWSLLILPFGCAALIFQYNLSRYLAALKLKPKVISSEEIFSRAQSAPLGSAEAHTLLSQAFLQRLEEKGAISTADITPEALPATGVIGEVRTLLCAMEETRYAGTETQEKEEALLKKARSLFDKLKNGGELL